MFCARYVLNKHSSMFVPSGTSFLRCSSSTDEIFHFLKVVLMYHVSRWSQMTNPFNALVLLWNATLWLLTLTLTVAPCSFISLPLPISPAPPTKPPILHNSTPQLSAAWACRAYPLTCWHVTHFPHGGRENACIGVVFPHRLLMAWHLVRCACMKYAIDLDSSTNPNL